MGDYVLEQLDENVRIRRADVEFLINRGADKRRLFEALELFIDAKLNRAGYPTSPTVGEMRGE